MYENASLYSILLIGWLFAVSAQAQPTKIDMKLAFAIYNGANVETVARLIKRGANVKVVINNGWTPLHYSASKSSEAVTFLLLENGADVDAVNNNGDTSFHLAARHNSFILGLFLIFGADINATNAAGETPLSLAAYYRDIDLLTVWSFPIPKHVLNNLDHQFFTANFHRNYEDMVARSIEAGADIKTANIDGETALHFAIRIENEAVIHLLLEAGANVNKISRYGVSPLHLAIEAIEESSANII